MAGKEQTALDGLERLFDGNLHLRETSRETAVHLATMVPGDRHRIRIVAEVSRVTSIGSAKGSNGQLLILTHRQEAMRTSPLRSALTLKKACSRKADAFQFSPDPGLIKGEIRIRPAVRQPCQLYAERCVRRRRSRGKELRVLARKEQIVLLWTIGNARIHHILRPTTPVPSQEQSLANVSRRASALHRCYGGTNL